MMGAGERLAWASLYEYVCVGSMVLVFMEGCVLHCDVQQGASTTQPAAGVLLLLLLPAASSRANESWIE